MGPIQYLRLKIVLLDSLLLFWRKTVRRGAIVLRGSMAEGRCGLFQHSQHPRVSERPITQHGVSGGRSHAERTEQAQNKHNDTRNA